jgi:hypothetical protein
LLEGRSSLALLNVSELLEISGSLYVFAMVSESLIVDAFKSTDRMLRAKCSKVGAWTACFEVLPRTLR